MKKFVPCRHVDIDIPLSNFVIGSKSQKVVKDSNGIDAREPVQWLRLSDLVARLKEKWLTEIDFDSIHLYVYKPNWKSSDSGEIRCLYRRLKSQEEIDCETKMVAKAAKVKSRLREKIEKFGMKRKQKRIKFSVLCR